MTKEEFAKVAASECASEKTSAHHGGGKDRPFWNPYSIQFMYAPAFQFNHLPGKKRKYRYTAEDETGKTHTFESESASAILSPIWADIPEGVVKLTVQALDKDGNEREIVGCRTFFRLSPFPADLPEKNCAYSTSAAKAYDYAMSQTFIRHWLTEGTPDPDYDLNVYPSKMISSIITAMIYYAKVCPEKEADAVKVAKNAADYLIGITPREGVMKNVPPTYQVNFRPNPEKRKNATAMDRIEWVMMIYPAHVGYSYLELEKKTGEKKYFDEALKIGEHYLENVQENGSWYLIRNINTGEVLSPNYCEPLERIVPFLMSLYERTGDEKWKKLAEGAIEFVERNELTTYEWEAQFEDSVCSENYSNLTHYGATAMVRYLTKYYADDEGKMKMADDLMRFVEDQFVIWKRPAPWNRDGLDTALYHTPCGLEQYQWYVPIDASTGDIITAFIAMYKAGRGELHLEKAKALADSLTRVQREDGMIPTHWMSEEHMGIEWFWINCLFVSAGALTELSEITE